MVSNWNDGLVPPPWAVIYTCHSTEKNQTWEAVVAEHDGMCCLSADCNGDKDAPDRGCASIVSWDCFEMIDSVGWSLQTVTFFLVCNMRLIYPPLSPLIQKSGEECYFKPHPLFPIICVLFEHFYSDLHGFDWLLLNGLYSATAACENIKSFVPFEMNIYSNSSIEKKFSPFSIVEKNYIISIHTDARNLQ